MRLFFVCLGWCFSQAGLAIAQDNLSAIRSDSTRGIVVYADPDGDDGNSGIDPTAPMKSIAPAIERAMSYDRLLVDSSIEYPVARPSPVVQLAPKTFRVATPVSLNSKHSG